MRSYREFLTHGVEAIAKKLEAPDDLELTSANPIQQFFSWVAADNNRQRLAGRVAWVMLLLVLLLITIVFIPGLGAQVLSSRSWAIGFFCAIWGLVVGGTLGLILPSKVVTAISGAAAGLTLNDLTSGSYTTGLDAIAKQVAALVLQSPGSPDVFVIRLYVVVFLIFMALACAPAFFTD
ncbi:MAG: hypothetical protein E6J20_03740 [Chloroflexi bacterium]|nr:MAG: hypothetical protein E6J20_03740 [Chloroflexota bacterium]